ncbi:Transposon TX1 uncharacterized protein [Nymphaea thermarum]|nr:Transposon TX1 uncharacterized protein [Nymphaea thermarum]
MDVSHFCPISILGTPYNIIAKLLSLQLAPIMPSIINPFQVVFIKGRRLQDAVVIANEIVYFLYCPRLHSFILKLDISKTFDLVSWEFLSDLLTRLAFGLSFRQWILSLVIGAQLAVSFNGMCGDFFCLGHGVRQVIGFLIPHSLFHLQAFSTLQYVDDFLLIVSGGCGLFPFGGAFGRSATIGSSGAPSHRQTLWLVLCRGMSILLFGYSAVLHQCEIKGRLIIDEATRENG